MSRSENPTFFDNHKKHFLQELQMIAEEIELVETPQQLVDMVRRCSGLSTQVLADLFYDCDQGRLLSKVGRKKQSP